MKKRSHCILCVIRLFSSLEPNVWATASRRLTAQVALSKVHYCLVSGAVTLPRVVWPAKANIALQISAQLMWTEGYRGFDVLHLATTPHLGASYFLALDRTKKTLAEAEGLTVPKSISMTP